MAQFKLKIMGASSENDAVLVFIRVHSWLQVERA